MFSSGVKALTPQDVEAALALCEADPVTNCFVTARLRDGALGHGGAAYGVREDGLLRSFVWASANVVPVNVHPDDRERYASRLRRGRYRFSSVFGPADQVLPLWTLLARWLPRPQSLRANQPLMVAQDVLDVGRGNPDVRLARLDELDAIQPAAAAMFTEEIGYAPYTGSDRAYRASLRHLIETGRTFVLTDTDGTVRFKADVGSLASGVAQIQGVWMHPQWRGRGLAAGCMIRTVELVRRDLAPTVSLYVNDFNTPALRTYAAAGFHQVGTFATVIL